MCLVLLAGALLHPAGTAFAAQAAAAAQQEPAPAAAAGGAPGTQQPPSATGETPAPAATPPQSQPPASPGETAPQAKPGAASADAEAKPEPGEVRVKAESYQQLEKGHMEARGTVDLRVAGLRLLADKADVYEEPQPDGSVRRRMVAVGNVVFIRGEERLAGDRAEMDDTGRGFFENAVGYVEPGVFIEARRIERVDEDTYEVEGARFTSCSQPNPRWKFSARRARIEVDDKIVAKKATLRVKGVPALWLPYLQYPISKDGRSTGFLIPSVGYSRALGFTTATGFFWAMGRSLDQTFYLDYWSKLGQGFGHELRYQEQNPSRGRFKTYVFDVKGSNTFEYDIDWNAQQQLPGNTRATLAARKSSNLLFRQRFQESFDRATSRTERWSGAIEHDFHFATLNAYADATTTSFGAQYSTVSDRLPGIALRRYPQKLPGKSGLVFGLQATAERIRYGFGSEQDVQSWSRMDLSPTLSRPFTLSFLEFNPQVGYRVTRYGSSLGTRQQLDEEGNPVVDDGGNPVQESGLFGPPIDRRYFETSVDMRGPTFARVFDTPGFFYSERIKHTIGPEVTWQFRTRIEDVNAMPKGGGDDWVYGTNQVSFALVQRFFAKRASATTGKLMPWSFFEWRLMQTYYVKINENQSAFDPNYSSSAYGPGSRPEHLSPILSRFRLRPTQDYSLDYSLEYDVNFKQLRRMSLGANITSSRAALRATWSRAVRLDEDPAKRIVGSHTLRGDTALQILPRRFTLEGSLDYDLVHDTLYQMRALARYSVQCCGVSVEHVRYNWSGGVDQRWRFNIELANMGAVGSFLGAGPAGGSPLGAYR